MRASKTWRVWWCERRDEYNGNGKCQAITNACTFTNSARSSLIVPFLLPISPRPTRRHFSYGHLTRHVFLAMLLAAILLIDIILITSYCTTSHRCYCHSESCANHVTKLAIILIASFSPSYLPHLTHTQTRCILLALILTASYWLSSSPLAPSLTSYFSLCIVPLPSISVTLRATLTMSQSSPLYSPYPTCYHLRYWHPHCHPPDSHHAHHVVLIALCSSCCAQRVVLITLCSSRCAHHIVLIASCSMRCVVFANVSLFPCEVW